MNYRRIVVSVSYIGPVSPNYVIAIMYIDNALRRCYQKHLSKWFAVIVVVTAAVTANNANAAISVDKKRTLDSNNLSSIDDNRFLATQELVIEDVNINNESLDNLLLFAPRVIIRPGGNNRTVRIQPASKVVIGPPQIPVHITVLCGTATCQNLTEADLETQIERLNRCFFFENDFGQPWFPIKFVYKSGTLYSEVDQTDNCWIRANDASGNWHDFHTNLSTCDTSGSDKDFDPNAVNMYIYQNVWKKEGETVANNWGHGYRNHNQPVFVVDIDRLDISDTTTCEDSSNPVAHEMGHAMGLGHLCESTSITGASNSYLMSSGPYCNEACSGDMSASVSGTRDQGIPFDSLDSCPFSAQEQYDAKQCPRSAGQAEIVMDCVDDIWRNFYEGTNRQDCTN